MDLKIENKKDRSMQMLLNDLDSASKDTLKMSSKLNHLSVSGQTLNIDDVEVSLATISCRNGTTYGLNVAHPNKCRK